MRATADTPFPGTKRDMRAFLGLLGYYRRFIPQFSGLATPLTDALKKEAKAKHLTHPSPEMIEAFIKLKKAITSGPILSFPDFGKPFVLHTDASNHGVGGRVGTPNCLYQPKNIPQGSQVPDNRERMSGDKVGHRQAPLLSRR